jgi:diaminopimelate epimerase
VTHSKTFEKAGKAMDIAFLKLQASGNDYIGIDTAKTPAPEEKHLAALSKKICDRRTGVGGEGLFFLTEDEHHRLAARVLTPEGGEGESCGAALQCAARYAFDAGLATKKNISLMRGSQSVPLEIIDTSNIRQDMGAPFSMEQTIELKELPDAVFTRPVIVEEHEYSCTPVVL